jgi:hypothetical protein
LGSRPRQAAVLANHFLQPFLVRGEGREAEK